MSKMSSLGGLMNKLKEASTPPDYRVRNGDGVKYFEEEGRKRLRKEARTTITISMILSVGRSSENQGDCARV